MHFLSKKGYGVDKSLVSENELNEMKKELVSVPLTNNDIIPVTFPVYVETRSRLYVPKMYGIKKFGYPEFQTSNFPGKDPNWTREIKFNGELYESQLETVNVLLEKINDRNYSGGIICCATGTGKTVNAIYTLSKIKGKALIIVPSISLMDQWMSEINHFLPDATVGIIQGQKLKKDLASKDILIGMLQSLSKIDYPEELFENIKVTVFDEVQYLSTRCFSRVFFKVTSQISIGLSATPKRSDGTEYVFKWHIGDIVYESKEIRKGNTPTIKLIKLDSKEYNEYSMINYKGQKQLQYTTMISDLISMPKRNKLIVQVLKELVKTQEKILVMSERREHLSLLKTLFDDTSTNDDKQSLSTGLFLGSMKKKDLDQTILCKIIFATFTKFAVGVSVRDLDTLVLVTPKTFTDEEKKSTFNSKNKNDTNIMEQSTGRIFRKNHKDTFPIIIDFCDNFSLYKNQSLKRRQFYTKRFEKYNLINSKIDLDQYHLDDINTDFIKETKKLHVNNTK
jgi:hypothetical protein